LLLVLSPDGTASASMQGVVLLLPYGLAPACGAGSVMWRRMIALSLLFPILVILVLL
jgi:hypothetical protein